MKKLGFVVLMVSLLSVGFGVNKLPSVQYLSPLDFQKQMAVTKSVVLVDIRTAEEFSSGHIHAAQLINVHDSDFALKVSKLDKSKTIMIYCRSGRRTELGREELQKQGFKIAILKGGLNAWNEAALPTEK